MSTYCATAFLLLLAAAMTTTSGDQKLEVVQEARTMVEQARNWVRSSIALSGVNSNDGVLSHRGVALGDCARLYGESETRLARLVSGESYSGDDARTWLSGVVTNHRTCLDGLAEKGFLKAHEGSQNLTTLLSDALALYAKDKALINAQPPGSSTFGQNEGLLASWNPATSKADFTVAKDGSGTHQSINDALAAVARMGHNRPQRVIIYVKFGVYNEKVEINDKLHNIMLVGDGIDKTIVTGNRNVPDGATTSTSATFGVSGDGFWARDMTFENTAGPQKHQAVALKVSSDQSVFYRCSIKGYQDTLYVHSSRQFYRDCHIYGTVDFIFGNAAVVFQNCDIFVRKPMGHQSNMITAQGRDNQDETTGISIHASRVRPSPEFVSVKNSFKTYLGRPWKTFSRTVVFKTDLDKLIHPRGWLEWSSSFALSTLYYAEYMNTGEGANTGNRVNWPGFHVLRGDQEAIPFTVNKFIQGEFWIPGTGVPFLAGV